MKVQVFDRNHVVVSEYIIELDFFHEVPPDDESKCIRRFVFFFSAENIVSMEMLDKGIHSRTDFTLRGSYRENIFSRIPEDRDAKGANVALVFREYLNEVWLINNGILLQALLDYEEELLFKRGKESSVVRSGNVEEAVLTKTKDLGETDEYLTEESLWEKRMEPLCQESSHETYVTEDSLWEKRMEPPSQ